MPAQRATTIILTAILTAATVLMLAGAWDEDHPEPYRLGLALAVLAATGLLAIKSKVTAAVIERERQRGYDDGYDDGCSDSRPARLRLARVRGALGGATEQLSDESDLGSRPERVG